MTSRIDNARAAGGRPCVATALLRSAAAFILSALVLPAAPADAQSAHDHCEKVDVVAVKLRDKTVVRVRLCGPGRGAPAPAEHESPSQPQAQRPQPQPSSKSKRSRNNDDAPRDRRSGPSPHTLSAPQTAVPAPQPADQTGLPRGGSSAAAPTGSADRRSARDAAPTRDDRRDRQRHERDDDEQPALAAPSARISDESSGGGWWLAPLPLLGAALLALGGAWLVMGSRSDRLAYAAAGAAGARRRRESWWTPKAVAETIAIAAVAFTAIVALQSFVIRPVLIPSASMAPTLNIGNQVVMERVTDRSRAPARGDIVVFNPPTGATEQRCGVPRSTGQACPRPTAGKADSHYIKRVVAAPGDRLQISGGRVYIDSKLQREPYAKTTVNCAECNLPKDITIPPGHYFLMGDNRADSIDSRVWGPVRQDHIIGRAIFRFWPPPRIQPL